LKPRDRQILVVLASRIQGWKQALVIVKPATLVRWHQQGFKLFWRTKSQGGPGRPPIAATTIALIEEMAIHNRTWRAKRIQGELLKLGIRISRERSRSTCDVHAGVCHQSNEGRPGPPSSKPCWRNLGLRLCANLRLVFPHGVCVLHHRVGVAPGGALRSHTVAK